MSELRVQMGGLRVQMGGMRVQMGELRVQMAGSDVRPRARGVQGASCPAVGAASMR